MLVLLFTVGFTLPGVATGCYDDGCDCPRFGPQLFYESEGIADVRQLTFGESGTVELMSLDPVSFGGYGGLAVDEAVRVVYEATSHLSQSARSISDSSPAPGRAVVPVLPHRPSATDVRTCVMPS